MHIFNYKIVENFWIVWEGPHPILLPPTTDKVSLTHLLFWQGRLPKAEELELVLHYIYCIRKGSTILLLLLLLLCHDKGTPLVF